MSILVKQNAHLSTFTGNGFCLDKENNSGAHHPQIKTQRGVQGQTLKPANSGAFVGRLHGSSNREDLYQTSQNVCW